jgi:hypothetical protein
MDCTYLTIHPSFKNKYGICVHFVALSIFITFITTKRIDTLEIIKYCAMLLSSKFTDKY